MSLVDGWLATIAALALTAACASQPVARDVVGPDGTRMLFLSCEGDEGACYAMAGARCSAGYDIYPTLARTGHTYLVRCRAVRAYYGPASSGYWPPLPNPVNPWETPPTTGDAAPPALTAPSASPPVDRSEQPDLGY